MKTKLLSISLVFFLALGLVLALLALIQTPTARAGHQPGRLLAVPVAADDVYTTTEYVPLSIAAPGVLANDSDGDTDPLTATLHSGPANGTLLLGGDGAFTYTPTIGFAGVDSFTYRADDGHTPLLAAYWPFDEGNPVTTTVDATGDGNDGTLTNGAAFTTTVPPTLALANPYAIAFDGLDDVVAIPSSDAINLGTHDLRTLSAWFNVQDATLTATKQVIWEEGGVSNGLNLYLYDGALYGGAWSNSSGWGGVWLTDTVASNRWHHVALVLDGPSGTLALYLDGQLADSGAGQPVAEHANEIGIGQVQSGVKFHDGNATGGGHAFGGLIDDVRVYNQALSAAQVLAVMDGTQTSLSNLATVTLTVTEVPTGTLAGTVTGSDTGLPIEEAAVEATYNALASYFATTGADGAYGWVVPSLSYTVTASAYGYYSQTLPGVAVSGGATTTQDIALDPMPAYVVSGVVTDALTGWPLYARIDVDGYPGDPVWTDPLSGYYSVTLATGTPYTLTVSAWVDGYLSVSRGIGLLTGDVTEDFALDADQDACVAPGYTSDAIFYDGFESGDLLAGGWTITATQEGRVRVDTYDPFVGDYSVLLDSAVDNVFSFAGIILPIDLSAQPQVYLDFWWREYGDEDDPEDGVFLSDDGGATWCQVFSFNGFHPNYTHTQLDLTAAATDTCTMTLGAGTQLLFQFYDNFTIPTDGYSIDQVKLSAQLPASCLLSPGGGLVVGHVYDENTGAALTGATVENEWGDAVFTKATPDDPAVDDGFYTLFATAGARTLTATLQGGYAPDVDAVTVPLSDTVGHDFHLSAGRLDLAPQGLSVTLDVGITTTLPLALNNLGHENAYFELLEADRGFTPALQQMQRFTTDAEVAPSLPSAQSVPQAINLFRTPLALSDALYQIDATGPTGSDFLLGVEYVNGYYYVTAGGLTDTADSNYLFRLDTGGDLVDVWVQPTLSTWGWRDLAFDGTYLYASDSNVLDEIDPVRGTATGNTIPCPENPCRALAWDPVTDHFWTANFIDSIYEFDRSGTVINTFANPGLGIYGMAWDQYSDGGPYLWVWSQDGSSGHLATQLDPATGTPTGVSFQGLGSLTGSAGGATIINGDHPDYPSTMILAGLHQATPDSIVGYDLDSPAISDVPWLSEDPITGMLAALGNQVIDVTFDAGAVSQPGTYYATLCVSDDTPYGRSSIPVTMTVNVPAVWGLLAGTVTGLGYCDADPTPLAYRDVLIQDSTGAVYSTTTAGDGTYQWWIDETTSPLTVTVAPAGYEAGMATGVVVTAGQVTTVDLGLRWLQPCVSVNPARYEHVLYLGDILSDTLDLTNSGAVSTTFELTETLSWLSENPVTGTLEADSLVTVDLLFDSTVLTDTGWYSGQLQVLTGDPFSGTRAIPVDLAVVSGTTGLQLGPDAALSGANGTAVTYTLALTNSGEVIDIYDLSLAGHAWPATAPADTGFVNPGEVLTVTVVVTIPVDATGGSSDAVDVIATSRLDAGVSDRATLATTAEVAHGVQLDPPANGAGDPGADVVYTLILTNTGNVVDSFELACTSPWPASCPATAGPLAGGAATTFDVTVSVPLGTPGGASAGLAMTATLAGHPSVTASALLTTTANQVAPLADDDAFTVAQGSTGNLLDVLDGDVDHNADPLVVAAVGDPPNGAAVANELDVLYTPDPGFFGTDVFTYTVSDGQGGTDVGQVTVTVTRSTYEVYLPLVLHKASSPAQR